MNQTSLSSKPVLRRMNSENSGAALFVAADKGARKKMRRLDLKLPQERAQAIIEEIIKASE